MTILSFKRLLTWDDHLKVGQPQIDAQHEAIFRIAMEVADLSQDASQVQRLSELLYRLDEALAQHFEYEERQLAEIRYPGIETHKAEHALMREELRTLRDRLHEGSTGLGPTRASSLRNRVLGVTIGHICHSDLGVSAFLQQGAGARKARIRATESVAEPLSVARSVRGAT